MRKEIEIALTPKQAYDPGTWKSMYAQALHIPVSRVKHVNPLQRSLDARAQKVKYRLKAEVFIDETPVIQPIGNKTYADVSKKSPVIVVGAGPAGLFAALRLINNGFKPIIIERGKDVKNRKQDIAKLNNFHIVNPDSNYCFGEGGAGTYSDGKLYTRSSKRGNIRDVLETLVEHGADKDILLDSHPHIGTDKLPHIISLIHETIESAGGAFYFNERVIDLHIQNSKVKSVETHTGKRFEGIAVILATGHSATDIYFLLHKKGILLEGKNFAMGVRAEHPQALINSIQYHGNYHNDLPSASYSLVAHAEDRGVFSFCMCPGGTIVPSATEAEQVVVNGMSNSKRNSPFANSGIVVQIEPQDYAHLQQHGALAGLVYQKQIEKACWEAAGKTQQAPAQRIVDFTANKVSTSLPDCSYKPGIVSLPIQQILPAPIATRLQQGFKLFNNKMRGYYTNDAVILATESRTSSPVRIPRNNETLHHMQIENLYPCGEGAGYAGGIVSSAMDGVRCANAIKEKNQIF